MKKFVAVLGLLFTTFMAQARAIEINAGVSYNRIQEEVCTSEEVVLNPVEFDDTIDSKTTWTQENTENGITLTTRVTVTKNYSGKYAFLVEAFTSVAGSTLQFQFLGDVVVSDPSELNEVTFKGQFFKLGNVDVAPVVTIKAR